MKCIVYQPPLLPLWRGELDSWAGNFTLALGVPVPLVPMPLLLVDLQAAKTIQGRGMVLQQADLGKALHHYSLDV